MVSDRGLFDVAEYADGVACEYGGPEPVAVAFGLVAAVAACLVGLAPMCWAACVGAVVDLWASRHRADTHGLHVCVWVAGCETPFAEFRGDSVVDPVSDRGCGDQLSAVLGVVGLLERLV